MNNVSDHIPADWVRPPLFLAKYAKRSHFFLIRIFWIGREPPLSENSKKQIYVFLCLPLTLKYYFQVDLLFLCLVIGAVQEINAQQN